jgi:drug/metabolite transporter (DMT)-like permease
MALFVSIIAVSTASILIRKSNAPPLTIATYRMMFSTLLLLPFYIRNKGFEKIKQMTLTRILMLIGVGIVLALHFASWITSLEYTAVASSVIFVHVDPLFVAVVSHFWYGEKISLKTAIGIFFGFVGVSLIAWEDSSHGGVNLYGDMLALFGGLMLGIYILFGRRIRQSLDLVEYVTPVYATSAIILLLSSIITNTKLIGFQVYDFFIFSLIAIIPMIFGHTVNNWALKYVSASIVSISLLGEPIIASILAFLILSEIPSVLTIVGGIITFTGILLAIWDKD